MFNINGNYVPQNNKTDLHNNKNRDTVISNYQRASNKNHSRIVAVNAFHRNILFNLHAKTTQQGKNHELQASK